jgi:histidinol dehydrogenase
MPIRLDRRAPDFAERFRAFLATKREASADVEAAVRAIIADVAARGDRAVVELTRRFERFDPDRSGLKVTADEIDAAHAACDRRALDALASRPITAVNSRPTTVSPMLSASNWGRVGAPSKRSACTCPAEAPPIRHRC